MHEKSLGSFKDLAIHRDRQREATLLCNDDYDDVSL
jgi:hypothetical protein